MRSLGMKLVVFAAAAMLAAPVFAQTDTDSAKADFALEIHPSKIIDSPLGKKLGFAEQVEAWAGKEILGRPDLGKVNRIFAGLVAPENLDKITDIRKGKQKNDLQFFVRMEFSTADAAKNLIGKAMEDNLGEFEKNGRTYYKVPGAEKALPKSTVMYLTDEKTVELASDGFAYRTTDAPMTEGLATAWKAMPNEAWKMSFDGVNARGLLKSIVEASKKTDGGGNPVATAVMGLFPSMDNISLSIDLASANFLTMKMVGSDEEKSTDINDAFKSMMTLVKPSAKSFLEKFENEVPKPAAVFTKLVDGMDVKQNGKSVTLNIPRPEGFEDATDEVIPMVRGVILRMLLQSQGGAAL